MKKTKITESQFVKAIMEAGNVRLVTVITHELSNDPQTLYHRKKKCTGMDGEHQRRLKE